MNRKEFNTFVHQEVYKGDGIKGMRFVFHRFMSKYVEPATNSVFLFRKMQYIGSKYDRISKLRVKLIQRKLCIRYGIMASKDAQIGIGLQFVHPTSIIIGCAVAAGTNLKLFQNTTLGSARHGDYKLGNQPKLGNGVTVFANSAILGNISVGNDVIVGANSLLLSDAYNGGTYVGNPAKLKSKGIEYEE